MAIVVLLLFFSFCIVFAWINEKVPKGGLFWVAISLLLVAALIMSSYLYFMELLVFILSLILSGLFVIQVYKSFRVVWPSNRTNVGKAVCLSVLILSTLVLYITIKYLSSFDVSGSFVYTFFYLILGFVWFYVSMAAMYALFDLSWIDDVLNRRNHAATITIAGGFLGFNLIYDGANIGDGPGWWCVMIAGGLGILIWLLLGIFVDKCADVFERITVERDMSCGIRIGCYLLALGLILARASAGDWTSFFQTLVEFTAGWTVLPLTAVVTLVERYTLTESKNSFSPNAIAIPISIILGIAYVAYAVIMVILAGPLPQNHIYPGM